MRKKTKRNYLDRHSNKVVRNYETGYKMCSLSSSRETHRAS